MDNATINDIRLKTSQNNHHNIPSKADISAILEIVKMAYLDHQKFPTFSRDNLKKDQVRKKHLYQVIHYCHQRSLFDALGYLYHEWFKPEQFFLWARSNNPETVCRYRTSMFAESHFR